MSCFVTTANAIVLKFCNLKNIALITMIITKFKAKILFTQTYQMTVISYLRFASLFFKKLCRKLDAKD